ncbi:uncharacterized protein DUF2794 [Hoeflea marina]|uniref:Uncharacterized protein DUF2794 n=1 Tax=Hoeflea marina TaxID=274592 RepID=A0A317PKL9_9HYPH|nr:DUF2794 domain-containing protein [Hoeflea marina]PWV98287.1 uncharacterized protein DUF2794 [Hoeflea marina]
MTDASDSRKSRRADSQDKEPVLVDLAEARRREQPELITFQRRELDLILRLYGRMVAEGHWRDYAIDHLHDRAVISVFRRASEVPLYRIEKDPSRARRQGAFSITASAGAVLKRGHDLAQVLKFFDKPPRLV